MFQFDDLCSASQYVISSSSETDSPPISLELKHLPDSLKYSFWGTHDSLLAIIASDLGQDQEEKLINLLRENKEVIGLDLRGYQGY